MKHSGWKRFLVFITIFIMLFNGIGFTGDSLVLADNEEDNDIRSDVASKESNLMNMDVGEHTTAKKAILTEALSYDVRMQYLVTYAFLADKFGVVEDRSNYNKIYYGGQVTGAVGFPLRTDPEEVYQVTVSEGEDDGETVTGVSTSAGEEKDNEKVAKLLKDAEKGLATYLVDTELLFLSPTNVEAYGEAVNNSKKYFEGKWYNVAHSGATVQDFYRIGKGKTEGGNHIRKGKGRIYQAGAAQNYQRDKVQDYKRKIKEEIDKGESIKNIEDLINRITAGRTYNTLAADAKNARKTSSGKGSLKGSMWDYVYKDGGRFKTSAIKKKVGYDQFLKDIGFMPEVLDIYERSHGVSKNVLVKEFNERSRKDAIKLIKDDKNLVKNLEDLIKEINKEQKVSQEWKDRVEKDSRILGWIPLYPHFELEKLEKNDLFGARFKKEDFNTLLNGLEGSQYHSEGYIETKGGKERAVRRTDLFYSKKSTPVLVLNTKETGNKYAKVRIGQGHRNEPSEGTSIGEYAGIQSNFPEGFWKNELNNFTSPLTGKVIFDKLNVKSYSPSESSYNVEMFRNLAAKGKSYDIDMDLETPGAVGVDVYGNIIEADTGTILIPYWQNEIMKTLNTDSYDGTWVSHSAYLEEGTASVVRDLIDSVGSGQIMENKISTEDVMSLFAGTGLKKKDIEEVVLQADSSSMESTFRSENNAVISALALKIVTGTHENVKKFHENALEWGRNSEELFITTGVDLGGKSGIGGDKYTNDDLRERIMYHLDYGFWDPIKLSLAGFVSEVYNHTVYSTVLSNVFYTWKITDTSTWDDIMRSLGLWVIGLMGVYIVIMSFQVFRRILTVKDFVKQFLIVSLIILIPTVVYSPLIELLINKPTPMIVGKQMQQMAILDYSQSLKTETEEIDPAYEALFGGSMELRDREHDYIIEFYTTQHKNGYDITDPASVENRSMTDQVRSNTAERTGKWNKKDVVKVDVSMFDLFTWARQRLDDTEEKQTDLELFEWLLTSDDTVGNYEGIGDYEEFHYDPGIVLRNLGILNGKKEYEYEPITASELYIKLYNASGPNSTTGKNITKRLKDLKNIAVVAKENSPTNPVEMAEVEALIRDLSLTRDGRETAFSTRGVDDTVIELISTEVPRKGEQRKPVPAISKKSEELWKRVMPGTTLRVPDTDYLGLEDVIDDIKPETGDPREVSNDRHVYNVNEKVLNDYINIHYIVRESLGNQGNNKNVEGSETMMVKLNQFFRTNEELDLPMFPTQIQPNTYSLDTYTRMVYVPIAEYKDSEAAGIDNVGQYLVLRDNVILLIVLFLPVLALLIAWGFVYLLTFGIVMVMLTTISFIWNYVIKRTEGGVENKAWLNAVIVIVSFSIAKIGLLLIWFGMFYVMNEMLTVHGGFTYPYMVVHSIIIIAYIYVCFKYLFAKVLGNIAKKPLDLGGEDLRQDLNSTWNPITRMRARKAARDNRGGERSSKKAIDKHLEKEGEDGKVNTGSIKSGINAAKAKVGDVGAAGRDAVVDSIKKAAEGLGGTAYSKYSGVQKGLGRKISRGLGLGYENIDGVAGMSGISPNTLAALEGSGVVGQVLSTTADGEMLSVVSLGNEGEARRVKEHLDSQGIESNVNKNGDLLFNSTGLDMDDESVRKNLFGGLVEDLYDEMGEMGKVEDETGQTGLLNYNLNRDGVITIPVGDKGLSTQGLDTIINSKEFAESFIVEGTPWVDGDGNYKQGSLDVIPRKGVNVHKVMETVYKKDAGHREYLGVGQRGSSNLDGTITFEGIEERTDVYDMLAEGMYMHEGRIMYNSKDSVHRRSVNQIKSTIEEEYTPVYNDKRQLMTKAMAYTVKGGKNGLDIQSYTTAGSDQAEGLAREAGLLKNNIETVVYAGEGSGNVVSSVQQLKKLQSLGVQAENEYFGAKHDLYTQGEGMFLKGSGANRFDKALNRLATAGREAGGDSQGIDNIMGSYQKLGDDLNSANITSDEYEGKVEDLFNGLQRNLQSQGVYTKVLSTEINKEGNDNGDAKKALNSYINTKRKLGKEGVDVDVIEKMYNSDDYEDVYDMVGGLQGVEDKGDGVVKFTSDRALDDGDAARLVHRLDKQYGN